MLRFSIVSIILIGCGGSVAQNPSEPVDSGTVDTGSPVVVDTGSPPIVDSGAPPLTETGPGPSPTGATPPPRPPAMSSGGATKWFAVKKLNLGLTHRLTGVADYSAWKQYGYDLDARTTTKEDSKTSANSCKRRAGSPTSVLTDGELGRDNNFGQHFMAVVKSLKADAEDAVNFAILEGRTTLLLRLDNVGPADNASVPGALFVGGIRGVAPKWDGTDKWPIDSSSVNAMKESLYKFPKGYMAGGTWVSGDLGSGTALVPIPLTYPPILMPLDSAVMSFNVATGDMGTIAGAANTAKLTESMTPALKRYGICPGNATYEQVVATMTQSADLVIGAPLLQDVTRECDALSVGIGFTASPITASDVILAPPPPVPDECI